MEFTGKTDLKELLKTLKPKQVPGDYVFCVISDLEKIDVNDVVMIFKEEESKTLILKKEFADQQGLSYSFISSWITLTVHSSLEAVGLTAAISTALAEKDISCNVVAAYYHDHIFVNKRDVEDALNILNSLSK